jgi:Flp pilus assembly protein TadB
MFQAPMGTLMAAIGIAVAIVLATRMNLRESVTMAVVVAAATAHWWVRRNRVDDRRPSA